jgi:SAM-dependent methyltransferase
MKIDYGYHYRKWNSDSPEQVAGLARYYHRVLLKHLPVDKAAPILDVGCGMGFTLLALQQLGFQNLSGIDADEGQVASCRAKGLQVTLCADSPGFMRQRAGQYQLILAFDLLEHIRPDEQLEFVSSMADAIRSGGSLVCTTPNANSALAGRYRYLDWTHQTAFTEHSLDFLLYNGGFREIQVGAVDFFERPALWWLPFGAGRHWWAFRFFRMWRRLEMMAELGSQGRQVPLSLNLLAVARKP